MIVSVDCGVLKMYGAKVGTGHGLEMHVRILFAVLKLTCTFCVNG